MEKMIHWNGDVQQEAVDILSKENGLIVSPTKVGYIIMATDKQGLERKFDAKNRKRSKPAVVLCGSLEQFFELAEVDDKIKQLYTQHWQQDVLLGCILPWSEQGKKQLAAAGTAELAVDPRGTSCFVIKFGTPSEKIAATLWQQKKLITFASSANPSGVGNKGKIDGIGERIASKADLIIEADDYVASIQPNKDLSTRYEQGVMVSLVDKEGKLVTKTDNLYPSVIRKGLDIEAIMMNLTKVFDKWDYRQGDYY